VGSKALIIVADENKSYFRSILIPIDNKPINNIESLDDVFRITAKQYNEYNWKRGNEVEKILPELVTFIDYL
jgi:hypothetical protein